jgi:hypothetical protein
MTQRGDGKRGPKGGIKHQPGRGHDRKSQQQKKRRYSRKAARMREAEWELAREQWRIWDGLSDDAKKLRPDLLPALPRPHDEN